MHRDHIDGRFVAGVRAERIAIFDPVPGTEHGRYEYTQSRLPYLHTRS
ncbi:MAG TPA: hypothetical protein VF814_15340 [Casimicrobiaceae bacterium]